MFDMFSIQSACSVQDIRLLHCMGVKPFYGKMPYLLLWAGARDASGKLTISGMNNDVNYCDNLLHIYICIINICGRGLHCNTCPAVGCRPMQYCLSRIHSNAFVEARRNVMAHAQKPDYFFRGNRTSPFKSPSPGREGGWGDSVQSTTGSPRCAHR